MTWGYNARSTRPVAHFWTERTKVVGSITYRFALCSAAVNDDVIDTNPCAGLRRCKACDRKCPLQCLQPSENP